MKRFLIAMLIGCNLISIPVYAKPLSRIETECMKIDIAEDVFYSKAIEIIKNMERVLSNIPITGDVDIDYLNQMIALHDEEIKLSLIIQSYTSNPQIIELSGDILEAENGELREMRILRKELLKEVKKDSEKSKAYTDAYKEIIKNSFKDLNSYKSTGNAEKDYLNIMALNNKIGIELSANLLKHSQNDIVKKIAQNVIRIKGQQITDINRTLPSIK